MAKYIVAYVISCSLFCWFAYDYGVGTSRIISLKEHNKQLETYISKTQELQKNITLITLEKENEISDINRRYTTTINSLRNRPERTVTVTESITTTAECPREGSTGQQLFREDAEFLVRQAQLADILKESLTSCRRYLLETNP